MPSFNLFNIGFCGHNTTKNEKRNFQTHLLGMLPLVTVIELNPVPARGFEPVAFRAGRAVDFTTVIPLSLDTKREFRIKGSVLY